MVQSGIGVGPTGIETCPLKLRLFFCSSLFSDHSLTSRSPKAPESSWQESEAENSAYGQSKLNHKFVKLLKYRTQICFKKFKFLQKNLVLKVWIQGGRFLS